MDANLHPVFENIFQQFGMMEKPIHYRGYIIEPESEPWANKYGQNYRYMPEGGTGDDYKYAATIEEAKDEIFEAIMRAQPPHKVVMNKRDYYFDYIDDAIRFAVLWNAEEFHPNLLNYEAYYKSWRMESHLHPARY